MGCSLQGVKAFPALHAPAFLTPCYTQDFMAEEKRKKADGSNSDNEDSSDDEDVSLGALQQQQKSKKPSSAPSPKKSKEKEKQQTARVCTSCLCRSLKSFLVKNGGEQAGKPLFVETSGFARWMDIALKCRKSKDKCSAPAPTEKLKLGCIRLKTSFRRGQGMKGGKLRLRLQPVQPKGKSPAKARSPGQRKVQAAPRQAYDAQS